MDNAHHNGSAAYGSTWEEMFSTMEIMVATQGILSTDADKNRKSTPKGSLLTGDCHW
jgi:hypothetical protein